MGSETPAGRGAAPRRNRFGLAIALSLLLVLACTGPAPTPRPPDVRATAVVLSTAVAARPSVEGAVLPGGCTPEGAVQLLEGFLTAFNAGDPERLAGYFGAQFKWFSSSVLGE